MSDKLGSGSALDRTIAGLDEILSGKLGSDSALVRTSCAGTNEGHDRNAQAALTSALQPSAAEHIDRAEAASRPQPSE